MTLEKLLKGVQTVAVICNQWGDTGKGKFSDLFSSQWADVTARGTGGNNAGHTVVVNGRKKVFHLIPAGITNDSEGKITILGNGMVIDLAVLSSELDDLGREGLPYDNLMISRDANVIMPYHIIRDRARHQSQEKGGIGSTGSGIGPCYTDKVARRGIRIGDLFNVDKLAKKINKVKDFYPEQEIDRDGIIDQLRSHIEGIRPFVRDTVTEMHQFMRDGKRILLEGAQGLLLSIEHGTYPYVTSSDCSLNGTATGVGLSSGDIDLPLGIVKFPFMTRVGAGPFPTELGGRDSETYCAEDGGNRHNKLNELVEYGIAHNLGHGEVRYDFRDPKIIEMINSDDLFIQGVGIRLAAEEYGATTGRPRRTGWTDAVAVKYSVGINGPLLVLTKPDSLSDADEFNLCFGYRTGTGLETNFSRNEDVLRAVTPEYKTYGRYGDISSVKNHDHLPGSLKNAIEDLEAFSGGRVVIVSVGQDREETIVR